MLRIFETSGEPGRNAFSGALLVLVCRLEPRRAWQLIDDRSMEARFASASPWEDSTATFHKRIMWLLLRVSFHEVDNEVLISDS